MKNASQYRAMASLCRQHAAYNPAQAWSLLSQAERWEHLAEQEVTAQFQESNTNGSLHSADAEFQTVSAAA